MRIETAMRDAGRLIADYCKSERLRMDSVDFSILLNDRPPIRSPRPCSSRRGGSRARLTPEALDELLRRAAAQAAEFDYGIERRPSAFDFSREIIIGNAHEAIKLITSMAMRGEITALKLRDESLGKTILDIWLSWMDRNGRKSWSIGISGTEGEVDEWANRNRAYSRGEGAPNAKMGE